MNKREEFLRERNRTESEILVDEGGEFYFDAVENGNPGDDYSFSRKKIYLPDEIQGYYDKFLSLQGSPRLAQE